MMTTENPKSSSSSEEEEGRARDDPPLPRAHYNFTNFLDINQKKLVHITHKRNDKTKQKQTLLFFATKKEPFCETKPHY